MKFQTDKQVMQELTDYVHSLRVENANLLSALQKIANLIRYMHTSPETVRDVERKIGAIIAEVCGVDDVRQLANRLRKQVSEADNNNNKPGGSDE